MSVLLLLTGLAGFLTAVALLHLGLTRMALRYPLAIVVAYGVFLILLRLWLGLHRARDERRRTTADFDPSGLDVRLPDLGGGGGAGPGGFGGGRFGGGGAGGSWGARLPVAAGEAGQGGGGGWDLDLDVDEGWAVIVAVAAALGALLAVGYVIYAAPALLAEILLDGVLVTGLYRRVRGLERRHWLRAAVRRTFVPALVVALCFAVAGYALQLAFPEAHSIGGVWLAWTAP